MAKLVSVFVGVWWSETTYWHESRFEFSVGGILMVNHASFQRATGKEVNIHQMLHVK